MCWPPYINITLPFGEYRRNVLFVKTRLILGTEITNSNSNQSGSPTSVQPRFSDLGAMGFPNFGSGRFGNPTSNYPTDSFLPFGNQNNNMQRPDYQKKIPDQGHFQNRPIQGDYANRPGYPYHGNDMNPNPNYQRPSYPVRPNENQGNFPDGSTHGRFDGRPGHGEFGNQNSFPYQGDSMNRYPNYQRPPYPNRPNDVNSGTLNGPYQSGDLPSNQDVNFNQYRPMLNRPGLSIQHPPQNSEYPSQGTYQRPGNQNFRPDQIQDPSFRPDDINNMVNPNINFPNQPYQNYPNQYDPQTGYQNNQPFGPGMGQPGNSESYPSNYHPDTSIQHPADSSSGDTEDLSTIQFPDTGDISNSGEAGRPGLGPNNFNKIPHHKPQLPNNNHAMDPISYPNYNNTVAILGKPVMVGPTTKPSGQIVFGNSTENPTQKKCVQDCEATSEYNPVCGSNNVTYVNPGKFVCARNCGEAVYLKKNGRCDGDTAFISLYNLKNVIEKLET